MIKYTDADKTLVVPSGLGNFGQGSGSGGGISPEQAAEIASAVTEAAIDEYDTEIQVDLEEIRDAVSGNSEDISTLSATTQDIAEQIGNLSGVTADISTLSAATSANTENIASLSAATEAISESLGDYATTATTNELATAISGVSESLGNYTTTAVTNELSTAVSGITDSLNNYATTATTDALSAVTSALTENLEALSGGTPTLYSAGTAYTWCVIYDYDTINSLSNAQKSEIFSEIRSYGGQGKFTYIRKLGAYGRNQFFPQSQLTQTKAEYYSLGGANYDYVTLTSAGALSNGYLAIYSLPTAAANKKGGVKVGSGLTMNGEVMSVNIGEGLAFSGDTLVVSGGIGGVQNYVIVDTLDEITNPVEGMLAYVKYRRMNGWIIDASQITEDYAANVYYDGNSYVDVYRSGTDFYWGWNNDATDWAFGNNIWYKIDKENGLFYAACENTNAYVNVISPATTASTIAQMDIDQLYLYNGTAWEPKYFPPTDIYFENMTDGERMNLYDEIMDLLGGSSSSPNLPKLFSKYRFFTSTGQIDGQVMSEVYFSNFENDEIWFYGTKTSKVSYPVDIYRVTVHIDGSGTLQTQVNSFRDSLSE